MGPTNTPSPLKERGTKGVRFVNNLPLVKGNGIRSVLLYPPNKVFFQEDPFPADFVRRKPLFHELIYCLMANI